MTGVDAVIHLGAIRSPSGHPNEVVFRNNVISTYNVLEAAANLQVSRVVFASSINVLGLGFATKLFSPQYFPIEENHPLKPQDCYSLSKVVGEEICMASSRRTGISTVSLRFMWIGYPNTYADFLSSIWKDPVRGRPMLWSYIDARDAAASCRLSLEAPIKGHEAFFISADETFMKTPTNLLIRDFVPEVKDFRGELMETSSVFDCTKAKKDSRIPA
jgi:nucleoside-diphosphate-sugar epimerase